MSRSGSPAVHYARVDGLNLAYQVVGDGPLDLILLDEWATPLEARWDVPAIAGRLDRLASFARLISFDKRGTGLSDGSHEEVATPELWVRDVVAVADAVGTERAVLFGTHEGGPIALLHAASLPDRTAAVVLANTGPRMTATDDWPHGVAAELWRPDLDGIVDLWARGTGGESHIAATAHDPWWRHWYARSRRQQASPEAGLALMRMLGELDVRHIAPSVHAPTLILHRRDNSWWPLGGARWLAQQIEGAELVELDGADNYWWSGDADLIVDHIERFLLGDHVPRASPRELVTIMFTDLVDSTATASDLGDSRWRELLDRHDSLTVEAIQRQGGRPLKNLGDGFLVQFDGPAAAIRAAQQLRRELTASDLPIRIAIHTGEVERRGDDISGIAVHLAARLLEVAGPGEIVVSDVIRGLVAGSPIRFEPRGVHEFKGLPERWGVHEVIGD
ncbi:MAG: adenylate/guanylate cyclase domain-containing protein [Actinomycetota bacterium]